MFIYVQFEGEVRIAVDAPLVVDDVAQLVQDAIGFTGVIVTGVTDYREED